MEKYVDWLPLFNAACFILLAAGAVGGGIIAKKLSDDPSDSKAKNILLLGFSWLYFGAALGCLGVAGNYSWQAYDTARYQQKYSVVLNDTKRYRACNGQEMTAFYGNCDGKPWQFSALYNKDLRANRGDTLDVLAYTDKKGRVYCYPDLVVEKIKHKQK